MSVSLLKLTAIHSQHFAVMIRHARRCQHCETPVLDEKGVPGRIAEACSKGGMLLARLNEIERKLFKAPMTTERPRVKE